jgi:hypothetical protein
MFPLPTSNLSAPQKSSSSFFLIKPDKEIARPALNELMSPREKVTIDVLLSDHTNLPLLR